MSTSIWSIVLLVRSYINYLHGGGGRSPSKLASYENSLVAGKLAGNIANSAVLARLEWRDNCVGTVVSQRRRLKFPWGDLGIDGNLEAPRPGDHSDSRFVPPIAPDLYARETVIFARCSTCANMQTFHKTYMIVRAL